jgi:hypothetical protein
VCDGESGRIRSNAFVTRAWLWVQYVLCWCVFPLAPALRSTDSAALAPAVVTAHPRPMHGNFATMETDLSLGPTPAVADAASATIMRPAGELLRVLAQHVLDGSDAGRQTEALEGDVHILPSRLEAGHERER